MAHPWSAQPATKNDSAWTPAMSSGAHAFLHPPFFSKHEEAWHGAKHTVEYCHDYHCHHHCRYYDAIALRLWPGKAGILHCASSLRAPEQCHIHGADNKHISDSETRVKRPTSERMKWLKNPRAQRLRRAAPKRLWQISSTFHFSYYSPTSPPTGTFLKINKPQQSTSTLEVPQLEGRRAHSGHSRGKHPSLIQHRRHLGELLLARKSLGGWELQSLNPEFRHAEVTISRQGGGGKRTLRTDYLTMWANSQNKQLPSFANYCGCKTALPSRVLIWTNKFCILLSCEIIFFKFIASVCSLPVEFFFFFF